MAARKKKSEEPPRSDESTKVTPPPLPLDTSPGTYLYAMEQIRRLYKGKIAIFAVISPDEVISVKAIAENVIGKASLTEANNRIINVIDAGTNAYVWSPTIGIVQIPSAECRGTNRDLCLDSYMASVDANTMQRTLNFVWLVHHILMRPTPIGEDILNLSEEHPSTPANSATAQNEVIFMLDIHRHFDNPTVVRGLRDFYFARKCGSKAIQHRRLILTMPQAQSLPVELQTIIPVVELPYPKVPELASLLQRLMSQFVIEAGTTDSDLYEYSNEELIGIAEAAAGLSYTEVLDATQELLCNKERMTPDALTLRRRAKMENDPILELVSPSITMDQIGGMDRIKKSLTETSLMHSLKAQNFKVEVPNTQLILGMPGAGKSAIIQACGDYTGWPLLRLSIGSVLSSTVGSSEARFRGVLSRIDALNQCILWIDELEKMLGGAGEGSNRADGGVTTRIFGDMLYWMENRKSSALILATANQVFELKPELKRRFRNIWFVDVPTQDEARQIIHIHLSKRDRSPRDFNMGELARAACRMVDGERIGFTGSEIERGIQDAIVSKARWNIDNDKKEWEDISTADVVAAFNEIIPQGITDKEAIEELRRMGSRYKQASSGSTLSTNTSDIFPEEETDPFSKF